MKKLPPKEYCLAMAEYFWDIGYPDLSWDYLITWGFYEMYLDWQGVK